MLTIEEIEALGRIVFYWGLSVAGFLYIFTRLFKKFYRICWVKSPFEKENRDLFLYFILYTAFFLIAGFAYVSAILAIADVAGLSDPAKTDPEFISYITMFLFLPILMIFLLAFELLRYEMHNNRIYPDIANAYGFLLGMSFIYMTLVSLTLLLKIPIKDAKFMQLYFMIRLPQEQWNFYGFVYLLEAIILGGCFLTILSYVISKPERVEVRTTTECFSGFLVSTINGFVEMIPEESNSNVLINEEDIVSIRFPKVGQEGLERLHLFSSIPSYLFSPKRLFTQNSDYGEMSFWNFLKHFKEYAESGNLYEKIRVGVFLFFLIVEIWLATQILTGYRDWLLLFLHPLHIVFLLLFFFFFRHLGKITRSGMK